ncbi:MAG: alpha/beta fold hydrolase [Acidobacteriota bacterium]|nr:alpha/beta fold hydrolase [Blastocatellia bacterium]MDW8413670.1 alpha/beta fold hydrolase [Acidobacteriota bacterium]
MMNTEKIAALLGGLKRPEIAPTPADVIYAEDRIRLLHYRPHAERVYSLPILIVNSLVNKYYILDLTPGKSYVEYLLGQGFDVFMLDWGTPRDEDCFVSLGEHINKYLPHAVDAVLGYTGAKRISFIAYCMGGTMSLMYAALHPEYLKNLVLLATPVDFHNDSTLSIWGRNLDVDALVDTYGNIPADVLRSAFSMLKPMKNLTKYIDLLENIDNEEYVKIFLAFDYWVNDAVAIPGETFRQFMKGTYQDNLFVRNKMKVGLKTINLAQVTCSILNVIAEHDDIVPPVSSEPLLKLVGSTDKEELRVKGGHHGLSIGLSAIKVVWPRSAAWLAKRSGKMRKVST